MVDLLSVYKEGYQVPKWASANHGINCLRQEFPREIKE